MQIYLVGGAVRDQLLGLEVKEQDWVVVGASPEEMIAAGFIPVGKEFPVFLHPQTHEEYALARTERKISKGYKGFTFYATPEVTLEQDLRRRDLTINAIAQDSQGHLIDPFGGQKDLKEKLFRHVSTAFQEDPVRILRVARLATKLTDFSVHPETRQFMNHMVKIGEVDALVPERVWQEFQRALENPEPARFFDVLNDCGALSHLFSTIHYEGKGLAKLRQTSSLPSKPALRFALLLHDAPAQASKSFIQHYRVPHHYGELALLVCTHLSHFLKLNIHHPQELLTTLISTDALRRPERFFDFLTVAELASDNNEKQKIVNLKESLKILNQIDTTSLQQKGLQGKAFAKALNELRLEALQRFITNKRGG